MCFGELVGWPLIRGHHFVYDRLKARTLMFAFQNDKAANREEGHVVGSRQKTTLQVCYLLKPLTFSQRRKRHRFVVDSQT